MLLDDLLSKDVDDAIQRERTAFDKLAGLSAQRLVLSGAGGFGRRTLNGLRALGIEPLAFVDNNRSLWGSTVQGLRVIPPEDAAREWGEDAAFVVTVWNGQAKDCMADRIARLRALGCRRVIPAGLLFWKYPETFLPYYPLDLPHKLLMRAEEVRRAFGLWNDDASRHEYVAQIRFRLHLDYDVLGRPGPEEHYFPPFFRLFEDELLVDCGAFDGDTIRAFVRQQGDRFGRILAYEPDPLNWPRLQATVASLPDVIREKITCFPQAVGASSGTIMFNSTGTDLSASGTGTLPVVCTTLDEALRCTTPTMIKFDIEGAELDALSGSRETIRHSHPLLAVSAYHRQSHLWEVPLAIAGMSDQYCYGLRPHSSEAWDLVCYAIPRERWAL
jgi:FkbM family methyltransferase